MRWTKVEIEIVCNYIRGGKTYKEISELINRSESSIRNKASEIGIITSDYHKRKIVTINCLECGTIFDSLESDNRKFCSHSCSSKTKKKFKNCLVCQKEIGKGSKFCSNTCFSINNMNDSFREIEIGNTEFKNTGVIINRKRIKKYLIFKYGNKCMECGWCKINKKTGNVPIQMEHIDGNSENNSLDNLKLLCPNCHSLTSTYGSLNNGNGRNERKKYRDKIKKLELDEILNEILILNGEKILKEKKIKIRNKTSNIEYFKRNQKVKRPEYNKLLLEIKEMGYRGTARKYEVSDSSIRKWVKMYEKHGVDWLK